MKLERSFARIHPFPRALRSGPILRGLVLAVAWSTVAHAHEAAAKHGGRTTDAGAYHIELVADGGSVAVFLFDGGGRPVPAAGFRGSAVLVLDGKPARVALSPAEGNRLAGTTPAALPAAPKGAVLLTAPDGATVSGKFD